MVMVSRFIAGLFEPKSVSLLMNWVGDGLAAAIQPKPFLLAASDGPHNWQMTVSEGIECLVKC